MRKQYLHTISEEASLELKVLGRYLKDARLRRGLSVDHMRQACRMGRNTLLEVEAGDPATDIGAFLAVLDFYGMSAGLSSIAAPTKDPYGNDPVYAKRAPRSTGELDNDF